MTDYHQRQEAGEYDAVPPFKPGSVPRTTEAVIGPEDGPIVPLKAGKKAHPRVDETATPTKTVGTAAKPRTPAAKKTTS